MTWWQRFKRSRPASEPQAVAADVSVAGALREACDQEHVDVQGAERRYRELLQRAPTHALAWHFLGALLLRLGRLEEAVTALSRAAELRPQEVPFLLALARALIATSRFEAARAVYVACLAIQPDCNQVRNDLAGALIELDRHEEARGELEQQLRLAPDSAEVHFNLGVIDCFFGLADQAIADYRRGLALAPGNAAAFSNLLLQMNYSANQTPAEIFAEHRRFGERFATHYAAPAPDGAWPRRLRIGYISADFRDHVVMRFIEPVLESHDRQGFEIFCYHTHRQQDRVTARLRSLDLNWRDCHGSSAGQLADGIRSDRIDILVDLAGHTGGNSLLVLAAKPAPLQVTYLGYPNTTGLGAVDVRLTDALADPPGDADRLSTERLVRLPGSYFCYRPSPGTPEVSELPAAGRGGITFGCFNNFPKLSAPFLDTAAQILKAVPDSRLVLKSRQLGNAGIAESVRRRFVANGIVPERLELRGWQPTSVDHLAIYGEVDIALDSFPYNGATTTCEALWMGVPVVTMVADRHAGRVGASLLHAVGLDALIARDDAQYVGICARLASEVGALAALRGGLRERMRQSPLMNWSGFTRGLENCYREIWQQCTQERMPSAVGSDPTPSRLAKARSLRAAGNLTAAADLCETILRAEPAHLEALTLRWDLAFDTGAPGAAADWLNRAIASRELARFDYMLGCVLQAQGDINGAAGSFRRALQLEPDARAHNNLGCVLEAAGDAAGAQQSYLQAVALDPGLAPALYNLGNLHRLSGRRAPAIESMRRALAADARRPDWHCNLGELLWSEQELDAAMTQFRAALEIDPDYDVAQAALGRALTVFGDVAGAEQAFIRAVQTAREPAEVASQALLLSSCTQAEQPAQLLAAHRAWEQRYARGVPRWSRLTAGHRPEAPLNIGYLLPDPARHPLSCHLQPLLAAHDRARFARFGYASSDAAGELFAPVRAHCDHWRDLSGLTDEDAARRLRADGIDVLVDLAGHGAGGRMGLLARRPAPIQVAWLGYASTTGVEAVDFRLTDAGVDPEGETESFYSEKLLRLPGTFLCYAPAAGLPPRPPAPRRDAQSVVLGCSTQMVLAGAMIDSWAEALRALPAARLLLVAEGLGADSVRRDVRRRFQDRDVPPERLELRARAPAAVGPAFADGEIDIALDTYPCSGVTAVCEALWMQVPVVTMAGLNPASRTGASVLGAVGWSELVAHSPARYLDILSGLVASAEQRRSLCTGLRTRMHASGLTDAARFARAVEAAYTNMVQRR